MDKLKSKNCGFSIIEILIAMAIATLSISAVIFVIGGNQSAITDSQINAEALNKAQQLLESTQANARSNFASLVPGTQTLPPDGMYNKSVTITPGADADTFKVTSLVNWVLGGRTLSISLPTIVTNPLAGGSCSPNLAAGEAVRWQHPQMGTPAKPSWELVKDLIPASVWPPSNNFIIEDMAPYRNHLFIVGGALQGSNSGSFLLSFKIFSDPTQDPEYKNGSPLQAPIPLTPSFSPAHPQISGLPKGVKVNGNYAYIASGRDFCTILPDCGQLIVVNISKVDTQALALGDLTYYKIPGATGEGKSIFYDKGLVYIGLTGTGNGPEFYIIDVGGGGMGGTPTSPKPMGSYPVGRGIDSIYVAGNYAYLATDDNGTPNKQLLVLDITTKNLNPLPVASYYLVAGAGFGRAVSVSNHTVYLGRSYTASSPTFYILDGTNPNTSPLPPLGSPMSGSSNIASEIIRGNLAFLVTDNDFEIFDVSNPASITNWTSRQWASPIPYDGGGSGTAGGCKGNFIYVGSRPSTADKAHLAVFYPAGGVAQTITVTTHAPASSAYNSMFNIAATADSGLPVAITASGACSGSGTGSASITMASGSGTCSIQYNQSGNYNYSAATQVTESTTATKADQTIMFAPLPDKNYGDLDFTVSATASSGLVPTFSSQTIAVCTVAGTTVHIVASGTCTIRASQAGNSNYNPAPNADQSVTVQKAPSTTSVSCPLSMTYTGSAQTPCTVSVIGTGGLSLTPPATYANNTNAGTATASYTYAGDANHTGSSDSKNFTINKATQTITVTISAPASAVYNSTFSIAATASSGLGVTITTTGICTISGSTVTMTSGTSSCTVHYNQSGNANYNAAPEVTNTTTATKLTPTISTTIFNAATNLPVTTVTLGTSMYDRATVSGTGVAPSGNVTFNFYNNNNVASCTSGAPQFTRMNALVAGVAQSAPNITPTVKTSAGKSDFFQAIYAGDANYITVPGVCEPLTVN